MSFNGTAVLLDLAFLVAFVGLLVWQRDSDGGAGAGVPRAGGDRPVPLLRILVIGILVQFSREGVLAISGIRMFSWNALVVNSLVETNMGLPYLYLIHRAVAGRWDEAMNRTAPGVVAAP